MSILCCSLTHLCAEMGAAWLACVLSSVRRLITLGLFDELHCMLFTDSEKSQSVKTIRFPQTLGQKHQPAEILFRLCFLVVVVVGATMKGVRHLLNAVPKPPQCANWFYCTSTSSSALSSGPRVSFTTFKYGETTRRPSAHLNRSQAAAACSQ